MNGHERYGRNKEAMKKKLIDIIAVLGRIMERNALWERKFVTFVETHKQVIAISVALLLIGPITISYMISEKPSFPFLILASAVVYFIVLATLFYFGLRFWAWYIHFKDRT
jgi:hypothetical protein